MRRRQCYTVPQPPPVRYTAAQWRPGSQIANGSGLRRRRLAGLNAQRLGREGGVASAFSRGPRTWQVIEATDVPYTHASAESKPLSLAAT